MDKKALYGVIGSLLLLIMGLIVYTYQKDAHAQGVVDSEQNIRIDRVEDLTQKLTESNLLLTQIVCQQKGANCQTPTIKK